MLTLATLAGHLTVYLVLLVSLRVLDVTAGEVSAVEAFAAWSLVRLLGFMRDECRKLGRDPATIEVTSGRTVPDLDGVKRLQDLGVSRFMVPPPGFDPESITQGLERLGNEVLAKL